MVSYRASVLPKMRNTISFRLLFRCFVSPSGYLRWLSHPRQKRCSPSLYGRSLWPGKTSGDREKCLILYNYPNLLKFIDAHCNSNTESTDFDFWWNFYSNWRKLSEHELGREVLNKLRLWKTKPYFDIPTFDKNTNFWMIRTKQGFFFDEFIRNGFVAIGWNFIIETKIGIKPDSDQINRLKNPWKCFTVKKCPNRL